jgi:predicted DCC family thiol-disulfide oxidoreductase YuxK
MAVEKAKAVDRIFYDGHCGLCHGFVRFVLAKDGSGLFRFAPLDSDVFRAAVPEASRANLGDSIVVLTADGSLLTRSAAVLHVLRRLGGLWRLLAGLISLIPVAACDWLYDRIARIRHRLFRRPPDSCPVVPARLRDRFDL